MTFRIALWPAWLPLWICLAVQAAPADPLPAASAAGAGPHAAPSMPRALWIPRLGETTGAWLLLAPDHRVLRPGDLHALRPFTPSGTRVLPAAAQALNGRWGYIDTQGQWVVPATLEDARQFPADGPARIRQQGLWGYLGTDLKVQIKPTWKEASAFKHGRASVRLPDEKVGLIDSGGVLVASTPYRMVGPFGHNGLARAVTERDSWSYIDKEGKAQFGSGIELALDFNEFPVAPAQMADRWGVIDAQGQWVLKPSLERLDAFQPPGLAAFQRKRSTGYIDTQGREVIAPGDLSRTVAQGLIRVGHPGGSSFGFVDTRGQKVIAGPFDWVGDFDRAGGPTPARQKGQWGLLNAKGQWVSAGEEREPLQIGVANQYTLQGALSMWLHAAQAIEWKNDQGQTVYRLTQKPVAGGTRVVLELRTGDTLVWAGAPQSKHLNLLPFFEPRAQDLLPRTDAEVVAEARRMLAAPPRPFLPYSLVFSDRRDAYDLNGLDADDKQALQHGAMTTLAENYVSEDDWGTYYYLMDQRASAFKAMGGRVCRALQAAFGEPLPAAAPSQKQWQSRDKLCAWTRGRQQLMVVTHLETGDGDFEFQIALVVVPAR